MRRIAFLLIFLNSIDLLAQSNSTIAFTSDEKLVINEIQIDAINIPDSEIKGFELEFPYRTKNIRIDSSNLSLLILSKSSIPEYNLLYCYSILDKIVKWELVTQANHFELFDSLIYIGASDKEFMIDSKTGKVLWQQNSHQYHIGISQKNILISNRGVSDVEIRQATSGNILWHKKTKKIHGINDIQFVNDSTLLFALDGIYNINLSNGREKYVEMKTSHRSTYGFLGGNVIFSGNTSILSGYPNVILPFGSNGNSGLSSNILYTMGFIYIVDNNSLYSLKLNDLSNNWTSSINSLKLGISRLYDSDSNISLLNLGIARHKGVYRNYGQPFFALFDKSTGTLKSVININNHEVLRQFQEYNNEILLLSKRNIQKLDYQGNLLDSFCLDEENSNVFGELRGVYKFNEFKSKLYEIDSLRINRLDSINYVAFTSKGFLLFKRTMSDYTFTNFKSLGSVIYENDKIRLITGVEINKGVILKRVMDLVYVVDVRNGTIIGNFKFRSMYNKQNYIIGVVDKKVQVFKIQED
jgi:hypothetical protein